MSIVEYYESDAYTHRDPTRNLVIKILQKKNNNEMQYRNINKQLIRTTTHNKIVILFSLPAASVLYVKCTSTYERV